MLEPADHPVRTSGSVRRGETWKIWRPQGAWRPSPWWVSGVGTAGRRAFVNISWQDSEPTPVRTGVWTVHRAVL